jgi:phage-related protein
MNYELIFYISNRGENLVQDFIDSQDQSTRSKYGRLIALLIQYGPILHYPYSRKLTKNLYELRGHGDTKIRIIYTCINQKYILLHAFKKKTQKTPQKEINIAEKRYLTLI